MCIRDSCWSVSQSVSPSVFTVAVYTQLEVGTQRPFQDIEEEEFLDLVGRVFSGRAGPGFRPDRCFVGIGLG